MPRLKFDPSPVGPAPGETVEEHNARTREYCERWTWIPRPDACGCGLYVEGMLCTCDPNERERRAADPAWVAELIQRRRRGDHDAGLKAKREFPRLPRCEYGTCYWCREPIVHGKRPKSRAMHDGREDEPDCRHAYELRTRRDTQQPYLLRRDGIGCAACARVVGRWGLIWHCAAHLAPDRGYEGETSVVGWASGLEVDHAIALAVAWEVFPDPDRRRWFFGPGNLRLLCHDCHAAKTRDDVVLLKLIREHGPEWGRAEVLRRLSDAGLLRLANPKGAT